MDIIKNINQIKKSKKITNETISEKSGIALGTINKLFAGNTSDPKISTIIQLASAFDCSIDELVYGEITPNKEEQDLVEKYRKLDEKGKNTVIYILNNEYERSKSSQNYEFFHVDTSNFIKLKLFDIAVSAGTGSYLSSDDYSIINVSNSPLTKKADYAVRVYGDSMNPKYENGDLLLVSTKEEIHTGDLGIFLLDGESYFKKLSPTSLVSLNPKYKEIDIRNKVLIPLGKVIGKLKKAN